MVLTADNERECTILCRSVEHGSRAVDCVFAWVESEVTTDEIKVYLRHLCWNFYSLTDKFGRTVLHAASSIGNVELIEWLIDVYGCDPDQVDAESGWSALHRAAFFGQLGAIWVLLQKGASIELKDHDGFTPLDIILRDREPRTEYLPSKQCSLHVWGEDENLSLGLGSTNIAQAPKMHPKFPLGSGIRDAALEKFHSVFLTESHRVLVCGQGPGGRLGTGDESGLMIPEEIPAFRRQSLKILQVSAGQDHTVFLDSEGSVYVCGTNKYHQLGLSARPAKVTEPLALNLKTCLLSATETVKGVGAGKFHSALFTEHSIYTWGLNAGQLGHPKQGERFTVTPRKVSAIDLSNDDTDETTIAMITSGDGAIAVLTTDGDVWLVHDYHVKKVVSNRKDIKKVAVVGGNIDHERLLGESSKCTDLKLLTLDKTGCIDVWTGRELLNSRVSFDIIVKIVDFAVSIDGSVLIVSKMGEVYRGQLGRSVPNIEVGWAQRSKSKKHCSRTVSVNHLKRVPNLHRVVSVRCDPRGKRFVALQNSANEGVRSLHKGIEESTLTDDLRKLVELSPNFGDIVVVCVCPESGERRQFNLHSVVLRTRSAYLDGIISQTVDGKLPDSDRKIHIDVNGDDFSTLIPMIYSGVLGSTAEIRQHLDLLHKLELKISEVISREREADVRIVSCDGEEVAAHRWFLAARSEYFNCMFSRDWREASSEKFAMQVPTETLLAAIDYLYTDKCDSVQSSKDINFVCDVLAFADHLLLPRLKSICENELFSRLMSIQNVCELFELAKYYQADRLLQVCADFICVNLTAILESQCFDHLSVESLDGIGVEYRANVRDCHKRIVGGCGPEPTTESIQQTYKTFKNLFSEDVPPTAAAETRRVALPKKPKIYSPPKRCFKKSGTAEAKQAVISKTQKPSPEPTAIHQQAREEIKTEETLEGYPRLGEVELEKKSSRFAPVTFRQVSQRTQKRSKQRSIDSLTKSEAVAISKCPWALKNDATGDTASLVATSRSFEETMKLESEYKEHIANFSLDKAAAEERAIADLIAVYEIGFNPDERVSIQRETGPEATAPVWGRHLLN